MNVPLEILEALETSIAGLLPPIPVDLHGGWEFGQRRIYESDSQLGTGVGPFVEVVEAQWRGTCSCTVPLAGIAQLSACGVSHWVKSSPASVAMTVHVSLSSCRSRHVASFSGGLGDSRLLSVPVDCGADPSAECVISSTGFVTGRVSRIARIGGRELSVLLLPGSALTVGRNRHWRFRPEVAERIPESIRDQLMRRRTGTGGSERARDAG